MMLLPFCHSRASRNITAYGTKINTGILLHPTRRVRGVMFPKIYVLIACYFLSQKPQHTRKQMKTIQLYSFVDSSDWTHREEVHEDGLYGVGVRVASQPPHILQQIMDIRDMNGRSLHDVLKIGDCLTHVDAVKLEG